MAALQQQHEGPRTDARRGTKETKCSAPIESEKKQKQHRSEQAAYLEQQEHTKNEVEAAETRDEEKGKGR